MTFLPVVERELRGASRRPRAYWGRFIAAAVAFVIITWVWIVSGHATEQHVLAKQLFATLSTIAFIYALVAGVALTADSISEEKREGTLGLLFLTDLKGYDVVLGKLAATSLHAFYGLIAIFPMMAIPTLLGGLLQAEYYRMSLTLLVTLFLSLSLGMLASAMSQHDRKAQFAALFFVTFFAGIIPLCQIWFLRKMGLSLTYLSPAFAFSNVYDKQYTANPMEFWNCIWSLLILSFVVLCTASAIIKRAWQDEPREEAKGLRERWKNYKRGTSEVQNAYRTSLLDVNPFYWLASRDRFKPGYVFAFLVLVALGWLWFYARDRREVLNPAMILITAFFLHLVIKVWVATESGKQIAEDKRSGALELIISTPVSPRQILDGQFLALLRQFGWPVFVIIAADLLMMLNGMREGGVEWVMTFLAFILIFGADLFVIGVVGMWLGLTSKRSTRALGKTLSYILVVPTLVFLAFLTVVSLSGIFSEHHAGLIGSWFVICALVDLFYFSWAAGNLSEKFREVVAQRFDSPAS